MFVYGDYGQFTFDSMTWTGSVYNLEYDNIGYQMEKLNHESKESLRVFDDDKCIDDIFEWMKEQLESYYSLEEDEIEKVLKFFNPDTWDDVDEIDIEEFCDKNDLSEVENIIDFTRDIQTYCNHHDTDKLSDIDSLAFLTSKMICYHL